MAEPPLTILGVYQPAIPKKTWREEWRITGDDYRTNEHFAGFVRSNSRRD
jgi:hypothetical protein